MRQFGIEYYGPIKGSVSGKRIVDKNRSKAITQFYEKVIESVNKFHDIQNIVVAGPGFVKNDFYDYIKNKHKDLADKAIIESTGSGGRVGIHEVLKKGTVEKLTVENRVASEMVAINNLLEEIGKNSSKVAYGEKETVKAINLGAVKLRDQEVRNCIYRGSFNDMLKEIANTNIYLPVLFHDTNGEVMVISSQHEGGEQLKGLGSMAAILRYEIA